MKHTDDILVAKVFTSCLKRARTIDEISSRIYDHNSAKSIVRVFRCVESLISEHVLIPKCNNGSLCFQVDKDMIKELVK